MIANQESLSRDLIAHIGLDWDDSCLQFHKSKRTVTTLSRWQVRQPIYTSSVKRWKNYDKYLTDLKQSLGPYFVN